MPYDDLISMRRGRGRGADHGKDDKQNLHNYFTRNSTSSPQSASSMAPGSDKKDVNKEQNKPVTNDDIAKLINNLEKKLEKSFEDFESKITTRLSGLEEKCKEIDIVSERVDKTEGQISEIETTVQFLTNEYDDLKVELESLGDKVKQIETDKKEQLEINQMLKDKISKLEADNLYQEFCSRKYNLLFYGVPERIVKGNKGELDQDTEKSIRDFFVIEMKIEKSVAERILIANTHRIKRRPGKYDSKNSGHTTPDPVIVKFALFQDRNLVLSHAKNISKTTKISVRTDLPADLKKKRFELSKIAYNMRHKFGMKTFIKETSTEVYIQYRKNTNEKWKRYNEDPSDKFHDSEDSDN